MHKLCAEICTLILIISVMSYKFYFVPWVGTSHSAALHVQWWFLELLRAFDRGCSLNFITKANAALVLHKI